MKDEKSDSPNPDDILAAITSFNDPAIITNLFTQLGWSYSLEIQETVTMAKQNANLSIKFKAIKHLRELLREAAEASGYIANVSKTIPNAQGGQTTFSAKRIAGILNPVKKIEAIEIKETQNDKQEIQPESNRGSDRTTSQNNEGRSKDSGQPRNQEVSTGNPDGVSGEINTLQQFPVESGRTKSGRDGESDSVKPVDGGETTGPVPRGAEKSSLCNGTITKDDPCISTRPPTCDQDLFPGISTSAEE
ncbi:hypothetical protein LCGC14_2356920 [marine sediment metagenome]|uniref:Uncharacterized protein n=1 Tax=marine sediment metagenome TaxID=412755 RepID=A0A0F9C845_9ZZZZ